MTVATVDGYLPGVLIVDDEHLVRSFLRTALEPAARIYEAADAERALQILEERARTTDLLLVDHVLPCRSGLEILTITKRRWPWIPVAILTGFGSEDLAVQALRAGANDYLRKPIDLTTLLQTVARLVPGRAPTPPGPGASEPRHPNIQRAVVFISEHFAEPITLADVAREAGLSRFHFCRLFHQEIGVPFHEHVNELRVRRAKALLVHRQLRVSDVAYAVGFNDLSHFDRTFRKRVGRSPSEYRASLQSA